MPAAQYDTFDAMRVAHGLILNEGTLPYALNPPVTEPVVYALAPASHSVTRSAC